MLELPHVNGSAAKIVASAPASTVAEKILKIGVIGYGYWGPNLLRNFQEIPTTQVAMLADLDANRLARARVGYPNMEVTRDYHELLASDVDAVVVATPVMSHFRIAQDCLAAGKHVLVEKPLTRTSAEARQLVDLARQKGKVLMVGHTFEYSPAVQVLKEAIASGEIGDVYYTHSTRTNLGLFQKDINVLWDLAPHDISILLYVLGLDPIRVNASGNAYVQPGIHDIARLTLDFPNQIQSHVHISWLDPCKVRRLTIVGTKKMIVYDDVEMQEKIKIYDKGVKAPSPTDNYGEFQLSYRYGSITIPVVPMQEPLKIECSHFADCILNAQNPRSNGDVGLKVVQILESAQRSLLNGGGQEPVVL